MSASLRTQLRDYGRYHDATQPPIRLGDVEPGTASKVVALPAPAARRSRPVVLVAACTVAVVAVAAVAWLTRPAVSPSSGLTGLVFSRVRHDPAVFASAEPVYGEGTSWESGASMNDVVLGGPGLVAVGFDGSSRAAVWTSVDGIEWVKVTGDDPGLGGGGYTWMEGVTAGPTGLVAVGTRFDETGLPGAHAAVWTSSDGIEWTAVPRDDPVLVGAGGMRDVVAGGPGFVAVGGDSWSAAVWTSPDGRAWTRVEHDPGVFGIGLAGGEWPKHFTEMTAITTGGPGFVAVGSAGSDGAIWVSADGLTWSRVAVETAAAGGPGNQVLGDVIAGGPGLVAVGLDEPNPPMSRVGGMRAAVLVSEDGLRWWRIPQEEALFGGIEGDEQVATAIASTPHGLVAVGGNAVWISDDGYTWSRIATGDAVAPGGVFHAVIGGGPGVVVVGVDAGVDDPEGVGSNAAVWVASP